MIHLKKINESTLYVESEDDIRRELNEAFAEYAEGYKFDFRFKQRRWDGKIRYFSYRNKTINAGLINDIYLFAKDRNYNIGLDNDVKEMFIDNDYTREEFIDEIKSFPLTSYGEPIAFRDYQLLGIYEAIKFKRKIFQAATATGKSSIIYGIIRLLQNRIENRILLIVPSTNLVEQMYSDFADYSGTDDGWFGEDNCARLYSEYNIDESKQVLISTWQSLQNITDAEFFESFDCVICDEVQGAKAKVLNSILGNCVNAKYRFGFTGTLPKEPSNRKTIISNFGPVRILQTTKQAMDSGYVAKLKIECKVLRWKEATSKRFKKMKWDEEVDSLCNLEERNQYICDLANSLKGNTLILTARVEKHGQVLYDMLSKGPKKCFYIFGNVKTKDREKIRHELEKITDSTTVANYQVVSTGWSVRNIQNVIFAFPSKGYIRVVQSIGRSIRLNKDKEFATLYDIADSFNEKNTTWEHFIERIKIYSEEQHTFKIDEIVIGE